MKLIISLLFLFTLSGLSREEPQPTMHLKNLMTIDSLGACQGAAFLNNTIYLYGDREVGMIRAFKFNKDSLIYTGDEYLLTLNKKDAINHPTGLAYEKGFPTFLGNTTRLNPEGTLWKAEIYCINWKGLMKGKTLDNNVVNIIEDDLCIQGSRPAYVKYKNKWYVATSDYGNKKNEVRLYDPQKLKKATKTSEPGVLFKKFSCGPWVQNLCFIPEKNIIVLIQNQIEGRKWRFTYLNFEKSIESGVAVVNKVVDIDIPDELEGFTFFPGYKMGLAVTSSRKNNVNLMDISW